MKKIILLLVSIFCFEMTASCTRADKQHVDGNILQCAYCQEDIYRCYSKKTGCYGNAERGKKCFYCGCPIAEHTKKEIVPKSKRGYSEKPLIKRDLRKRK